MIMRTKIQFLLVLGVISIFFMVGCGTGRSAFKPGSQYSLNGEVDNVFHTDLLYKNKKKIITVTSVGFTNGQGISIKGLHPGISKGKKVKILAEFFKNIQNTDVFSALQITFLPEQKEPESKKAIEPATESPTEEPVQEIDESRETSGIKEDIEITDTPEVVE